MVTSTHEPTTTVTVPRLHDVVIHALRLAGASEPEARTQAEILLEAELRGHPSHGVRRLPVLVERMRNGLVTTGKDPELDWPTEAVLQVDGRDGLGAVVARKAIEAIRDRAATTGIAMACVRRANHVGMLAPYVEHLAEEGLIGVALTTSEALVHPWGGVDALVGTNPIGIALPSGRDGEPFVLDMSTAAVSMGKILDHGERSLPLPEGWAVDAEGSPTTDPAAARAISPFGGPKGFALGLALELLVARLTQTELGTRVRGTLDSTEPVTKGDVFLAISPERLGLTGRGPAIAEYLDQLRTSAADPESPVLIPGDRARASRRQRLGDGVRLSREVWRQVRLYAGESIEEKEVPA